MNAGESTVQGIKDSLKCFWSESTELTFSRGISCIRVEVPLSNISVMATQWTHTGEYFMPRFDAINGVSRAIVTDMLNTIFMTLNKSELGYITSLTLCATSGLNCRRSNAGDAVQHAPIGRRLLRAAIITVQPVVEENKKSCR